MKLPIKISLILIILLGLAFYNYFYHSPEYFKKMRAEDPNWNISHLTVKQIYTNSFYADNKRDTVLVIDYLQAMDKNDTLSTGELISIKSFHIGGDTVRPSLIHIHKGRNWKIYLSIIPVIFIFILFFKYFQFDKKIRRFTIR